MRALGKHFGNHMINTTTGDQEAARHHDAFIDIFAAHDEEAAVSLTLDHWALSKTNMDDYIRPTPLASDVVLAG